MASSPASLTADADLTVKQVNMAEVTDLARLALTTAFRGYTDDTTAPEIVEERTKEMMAILQLPDELDFQVEDHQYRRFAGDESLPRNRYYSLVQDESGDDGGTLVRELQTYYRPKTTGIVQVYDTTLRDDRETLAQWGLRVGTQPALHLHFLGTRSRPNPFVRLAGLRGNSVAVEMPLTIERHRLKRVVDLRDPSTASGLARRLTQIAWSVHGREISAFPNLKDQSSFAEVIPSCLEQNVGGTDFANVIGLWLRHGDVGGLVYPSARSDVQVSITAGEVTSWSGFNYVHYHGAGTPSTQIFVHIASRLPPRVRFCPLTKSDPLFEVPKVEVHSEHDGDRLGSWKVVGLRGFREIVLLLSQIEYLLKEIVDDRDKAIGQVLFDRLVGHTDRQTGEKLAQTIFYALMGVGPHQTVLKGFIRDILVQTKTDEEMRFMGALLEIERALPGDL